MNIITTICRYLILEEGIELAGTAGFDLGRLENPRFNGNGGAVYGTTNLSGTFTESRQGAFGSTFFMRSLDYEKMVLSSDGFALSNLESGVVQFLSSMKECLQACRRLC